MRSIGRLFARDVADFARSPVLLALVLIVPLLLLLLIGHLNVRPMLTRIAVVANSTEVRDDSANVGAIHKRLRELASVEVFNWPADVSDPRELAVREGMDLVLVPSAGSWQIYDATTRIAHTVPAREVGQLLYLSLARARGLMQHMERLDRLEQVLKRLVEPDAESPHHSDEALAISKELRASAVEQAALPTALIEVQISSQLLPLFESATAANHALVPGFISLIAVFVPFVLASTALVREREAGTLATLIVVSKRRWWLVAKGKLMLPLLAGVLSVAALLATAQLAFDLGIKPGLAQALLVQAIAATVSALFGIAVSALIEASQEAYAASAVYLVSLILLTGMVHPLEQSAPIVVAVAYLFPLTVAAPSLENWMIAGASAAVQPRTWIVLALQGSAALALCTIALSRLKAKL